MATPKPQPTRAISVVPSPLCNIPNPALLIADCTVVLVEEANILTLSGLPMSAQELGIKAGDIIYVSVEAGLTITGVVSSNQVSVNIPNDPLAPTQIVNEPSKIYNGEDNNQGCVLYVGTGGSLETITAGGDVAVYQNVQAGTFIPVQTLAVTDGLAENIVALW